MSQAAILPVSIRYLAIAAAGLLLGLAVQTAQGASASWTPTAAGAYAWNNTANWTAAFPNGNTQIATLTNDLAGDQTINLNQAITIGQLLLGDSDGSAAFEIAKGTAGQLLFNNFSHAYLTQTATSGANAISAPIYMWDHLHLANKSAGNPLTLSGPIATNGGVILEVNETTVGDTTRGTVILGGANANAGAIRLYAGTLEVRNPQGLGDSTAAFQFRATSTLKLVNDGTGSNGTVIFGSPTNNPNGYSLSYHAAAMDTTLFVDRLATNSGNTIQLNHLTSTNNNQSLTVEGANGYGVRFAGTATVAAVNSNPFLIAPTTAAVAFNTMTGPQGWKVDMGGTGSGIIEGAITTSGTSIGGITKSNSSLWVLAGNNSFAMVNNYPIYVNGGVLRLAHANAVPGGLESSGGTVGLQLNGGVIELAVTDLSRGLGTGVSQIQFLWNGSGGGFSAFGADRVVNLGGAAATMTWNGGGGAIPTGATLILNSPHANAQIDFQNPIALNGAVRTIRVDDNPNSTADQALISGVLSGIGSSGLNKAGAGTLVLSGANTYNGTTTVGEGTLLVNGTHTNSTGGKAGAYTVAGGATLGGYGTITADVAVQSNGMLAPGNSIGTLTVAGNLDLDGIYEMEFASDGSSDRLIVTNDGILDLANGTLRLIKLGGGSSDHGTPIILADYADGSLVGSFNQIVGGYLSIDYAFNGGTQIAIYIPEPTSVVLLGLAGLACRRRRRN